MEAAEILSAIKCGDLYPYGEEEVKLKYKELAKEWHPDINGHPEAPDVFAKITELYTQALKLLETGQWEKTNYILLSKDNGKKVAINYDTNFDFELGTCYVTQTKVVYVLRKDKEKYYDNAVQKINSLRYKDNKMEKDLSRFLPRIYQTFQAKNGEHVIVLNKPEDVYPLKNVVEYFDEKIDARHTAWIISRLCNLACYLEFSGLVHNGIHINNCFVSPRNHTILLLGGWWYTTREGEKMLGTTKDIFSVMPVSAKESKKSSAVTDLESVKLLGRQLLGEPSCRKLSSDCSIPKPFAVFLTGGSGGSAYDEFVKWDKALDASYGKRKFIQMEVKDLYLNK